MCIERKGTAPRINFELEFCLTKEAYKKAYCEDGALWEKRHSEDLAIFHELFQTDEGKREIVEDINAINLIFFKRRRSFLNGFSKDEFSREEADFLKDYIMGKPRAAKRQPCVVRCFWF